MKRKIVKIEDYYMALKPYEYEEGWERLGKKYSIRGLVSLLKGNTKFRFIIPGEIKQELGEYLIMQSKERIKGSLKYSK